MRETMTLTRSSVYWLLYTVLCVALVVCHQHKCLPGAHRKADPGPETGNFAECHPWKMNSCCSSATTQELSDDRSTQYFTPWRFDPCQQNLTSQCERYLKNEECFYQCEPALFSYQDPANQNKIKAVPVCASYCDKWFEACKHDNTCMKDWSSGFNTTSKRYYCPANHACQTFEQAYTSAQGLCTVVWGSTYTYEKSNKNCMVMDFDGTKPNPNANVPTTASKGNVTPKDRLFIVVGVSIVVLWSGA